MILPRAAHAHGGIMPVFNIIIVDDDENLISGLRRTLRDKSGEWNITYVVSAKEALDKISSGHFDLCITDYKMPGMNGIELLSHVRETFPDMKRILLTGQSEDEVFETSNKVADLYLSKPLPAELIIQSIESILKTH